MRQLPALIVLLAATTSAPALGQTVVVGGEGRSSVDVNYDVLQLLGPAPDGAPPAQTYQQPAPAYQQPYQPQPQPMYQPQPQPMYQPQPQPMVQQPQPMYQPQPQPMYQPQPQPMYQPQPAYQPQPQPVQRNIRVEDLPFSVGPLTSEETEGGFDSVTVVGSPDMEQQAMQSGQVAFTSGTHQLVGQLRDAVDDSAAGGGDGVPAAKPMKITTARTAPAGPETPLGAPTPPPTPAPAPMAPQMMAPQPAPAPMAPQPMAPQSAAPQPIAPQPQPIAPQPRAADNPFPPDAPSMPIDQGMTMPMDQGAPMQMATQDPAALEGSMAAAPEGWQQGVPSHLLNQATQAPSGNPAFASIVFPPNSAAITPVAEQKVGAAARQVITAGGNIEIVSRVPSQDANNRPALRMALRRALVVRNTLTAQGMPEERIEIRALLTLVSSAEEEQSRELNRVELVRL